MSLRRAVVPLLLAVGCASASTDGTIYRDPRFHTVQFQRVAVLLEEGDAQDRLKFEQLLVADLEAEHVLALAASPLLPPTGTLPEIERARALQAAGADALLLVHTGEAGMENTLVGDGHGGVAIQATPWAQFEANLLDLASGETAWRTMANSVGNEYANFDRLLGSFCAEVSAALVKQGVLQRQR